MIAEHVLDRLRRERDIPYSLTHDAQQMLCEYEWPGNVRELENAVERACALSSGPVLHTSDFSSQLQDHVFHQFQNGEQEPVDPAAGAESEPPAEVISIAELEKRAILRTIRKLNGDKLLAARLLGIGKTTLYRKLKEYGIDNDHPRTADAL